MIAYFIVWAAAVLAALSSLVHFIIGKNRAGQLTSFAVFSAGLLLNATIAIPIIFYEVKGPLFALSIAPSFLILSYSIFLHQRAIRGRFQLKGWLLWSPLYGIALGGVLLSTSFFLSKTYWFHPGKQFAEHTMSVSAKNLFGFALVDSKADGVWESHGFQDGSAGAVIRLSQNENKKILQSLEKEPGNWKQGRFYGLINHGWPNRCLGLDSRDYPVSSQKLRTDWPERRYTFQRFEELAKREDSYYKVRVQGDGCTFSVNIFNPTLALFGYCYGSC